MNIRVYAVWFEMMPADSPAAFPAAKELLPDPRVTHFWDDQKAAGRWFKENISPEYQKNVQWDAFYLYGAEAEWKKTPQPLIVSGRTILKKSADLERGISLLPEQQAQIKSGTN